MTDAQVPTVDTTTGEAPAAPSVAVAKKAPKRFWYLVDAAGERVERDGKMPKIHGKNPFQAVQKAVTKYAPEGGAECEFFLREANAKPTKAGKVRVYQYKGWKTLLSDEEKSEFTNNMSITSKPHAKSLGHTLIDAPPPKKRTRKAKGGEASNTEGEASEGAPEAESDDATPPPTKKTKRAGKGKGKAAAEAPKEAPAPAKKAGKGKGKAAKPQEEEPETM
jgi:hypothetical protein